MKNPVAQIQNIYEEFSRGNVPAILELLSADVVWEYGWTESPIPWLAPGRGREHAARFFAVVNEQLDIREFQVSNILAHENVVVALVDLEITVRATGKEIIEIDEPHIWYLDETGRVCKFRHAANTYQHAVALNLST